MSDNRMRAARRRRRKRRAKRQFIGVSAVAVAVFLLALTYAVAGSFGKGEEPPETDQPAPAFAQVQTEAVTTTEPEPEETETTVPDVTPPVGTAKELVTWWDEEELLPEEFVEAMEDDTKITVSFQTEPDWELFDKEQEVAICLTDEGGNQTVLTSKLVLKHDGEAPEMTRIFNMTVFAGDTILYRKNVEVTDNHDENPRLTIDSSEVNHNEVGTYNVTYRAEDKAGNVAEKTIFVKVMEKLAVTQEMVDQLADKVLAEIFSEGMTDYEKAYAIYRWTKRNLAYTGHTDPSDIVAGAYQGLRYRAGDCFTFCAVAHMLYQRAGFQTMKVTRTAGYLNHYWNYVNIGDGWYHCDSNLYRPDGFEAFMKTTDELITYTTNAMNRPDYYVYEESLYPPCAGSLEAESETGAEGDTEAESSPAGQESEAGQQPGAKGSSEAGQESGAEGSPEAGQEAGAGGAPDTETDLGEGAVQLNEETTPQPAG